jgi:dihydropteroate synthase
MGFDWSEYKSDSDKPLVMGILNITPDSFSDGGKYFSQSQASRRVTELILKGADIVDIGCESTRPGSMRVPVEEEQNRLEKVLPIPSNTLYSLDTVNHEVADFGLKNGFQIVNQVDAVVNHTEMIHVIREHKAGYIIGHLQGGLSTMAENTKYDNLIDDIYAAFEKTIAQCLKIGVSMDQLAIDPGIGFSKTFDQNFEVLKNLSSFKDFGIPICVGFSRKSMIKQIIKQDNEVDTKANLDNKSLEIFEQIKDFVDIIRVHNVGLYN